MDTTDAGNGATAEDAPVERAAGDQRPLVGVPDPALRMLDPRVITLNRIGGAIVGLVLGGLYSLTVLIVFFVAEWPLWGRVLFASTWIPVAACLLWLAIQWPAIDYRHWRYRIDREGIEIWSGVVWRQAVVIPRSRVQHIDVSQGPIERSYGLATLSIYTAGTQYSRIDLPGLDHGVALTLRDALLPTDAERAV